MPDTEIAAMQRASQCAGHFADLANKNHKNFTEELRAYADEARRLTKLLDNRPHKLRGVQHG